MCAVSYVSDYYRDRTMPGNPFPFTPLPPVPQWDQESKQLLREVLDRLDKLDKRLGDVECHDESKEALRAQLAI